jgi:Uma2 family endonuclease
VPVRILQRPAARTPDIDDGGLGRSGTRFAMLHATMSRMAGVHHAPSTRPAVKLTYDDFLLFPDDGKRHELIDGEHYVTPSPNLRHQRISGRLHLAIGVYLKTHPIGEVFYAPLDVVFSDFDVVEPDLLYVSRERAAEVLDPRHLRGSPDLVIEIASKGTRKRDETIKRALYERGGAREYWLADPQIDVIRLYRRDGANFARPMELRRDAGDRLTTALLPGFEVSLEELFADR